MAATKQEETKFPIEQLRSHSNELFGVSSSTIEGATYGLEGDYTKSEVSDIIKKWLNKEVK